MRKAGRAGEKARIHTGAVAGRQPGFRPFTDGRTMQGKAREAGPWGVMSMIFCNGASKVLYSTSVVVQKFDVTVRGVGEGAERIRTSASPLAFRSHITAR